MKRVSKKVGVWVVLAICLTMGQLVAQTTVRVCYGGSRTFSVSGYVGSYTYRWETKAPAASSWSAASSGRTFTLTDVVTSIDVRCQVDTNADGVYDSIALAPQRIVPYGVFVRAKIGDAQNICYGTSPDALQVTSAASGGGDSYSYQWQRSSDAVNFSNIGSQTSTSYAPPALTASTYYRLSVTSTMGCGTLYSDTVRVFVYDNVTLPVITNPNNGTALCNGATPAGLTSSAINGGDGTKLYQWQRRVSGGSWTDIAGANGLSYSPSALSATTFYRVKATTGCGSVFSQAATIDVYDIISAGAITADQTICYASTATLRFTTAATGGGGSYSYQWLESSDGVTYSPIAGAIATSYTTPSLTESRYYKVAVVSAAGCSLDTTAASLVTVRPRLVAGKIGNEQTICYNTVPESLSLLTSATGGTGSYSYQWQRSSDGVSFSNLTSATATTYQPNRLSSTTRYRLSITSGSCGTVYSDTISVNVYDNLVRPVISTATSMPICYDSVPLAVEVTTPATGGDGSFSYQWQSRVSGGSWTDIVGATSTSYQPGRLTAATEYRIAATTGCGSVVSPSQTISVYPRIAAGSITTDRTICYNNSTTATFTTNPSGGGDSYSYQWLTSSDGTDFDILSGATSSTLTTGNLVSDRYYRLVVTSTKGCFLDTTNIFSVSVLDPFATGTIAGDTDICYNTAPALLEMTTNATGGQLPYSYQWQRSSDGEHFSNISAATETTYQPNRLISTAWYRLAFTSSHECGTRYSDAVKVNVYADLVPATLATATTAPICYDSVPSSIYVSDVPQGADGSFTYQWQQSVDGASFDNIAGATVLTYQPSNLRRQMFYRMMATSTYGCGSIASAPRSIDVYPRISAGVIGDERLICYNDAASLSFISMPTGGGSQYSYRWQKSQDGENYENIVDGTSTSIATGRLTDTTFYRCIVTSLLGCSLDTTEAVPINVLPQFQVGRISNTLDSVCYGYRPDYRISMTADAVGGEMPYSYQWQVSTDGTNFSDVPRNGNSTSYQPEALTATSYYRLAFTSSHNCGSLTSNVHTVKVNPLPPVYVITGDDMACYNQFKTYTLQEADNGKYTYSWNTAYGTGNVSPLNSYADSVEVLWTQPSATDSLVLLATDRVSGCFQHSRKQVGTESFVAPDRTIIVRKPGSNILVAEVSGDYYYQWGYEERATHRQTSIENSNRRYVLLPMAFDNILYDYYLEIRPVQTSQCYSVTYYDAANDSQIDMPAVASLAARPVGGGQVDVIIENPSQETITLSVYNAVGRRVDQRQLPPDVVQTVRLNLSDGLFVVNAAFQSEMLNAKIVVK